MYPTIHRLRSLSLPILLALAMILTACGMPSVPASTPTSLPTSTIRPTDTPEPTDTPVPTNTPTPTATATPDVAATQAAQATAEMQAQIDNIAPELKELGFDPSSGRLVWVAGEPVEISVSTYNEFKQEKISQDPLGNFVLVSDVQWNSSSGLAGCSLIFRSDDDLENGVRYVFPLMRLQNAPAWDIEYYKYGEWQQTLTLGKIQFSPAIKDQQDSTNRMAVVVNGEQINPYVNGEALMTVTDNKIPNGQIFFETWQESGKTKCIFTNGWLWELTE